MRVSVVEILAPLVTLVAAACDGTSAPGGNNPDGGGNPTTQLFPPQSIWYQRVDSATLDSQSRDVIRTLDDDGGWGNGDLMQIDFSIRVLYDPNSQAPMRSFTPTGDWYDTHCDLVQVPLPAGGAVEGESGYRCAGGGDCHLIVVRGTTLYEMWKANVVDASTFRGGCLAVWDLTRVYPASGRGEQCTSADAAGYPIAPLLFTAEEVKSGSIDHAIRFILPNERIRADFYVHPATHNTPSTSGGATAIPYGARLRLRADYPLASLPNEGARVVARAMQKYGMFLSDGGDIALTAASDAGSTTKWSGLLGPRDLRALKVTDFEMVDGGARIRWTDDCVRNP